MTDISEKEAELLSRIADPAVRELFELQKGWIYSELTFLMKLINANKKNCIARIEQLEERIVAEHKGDTRDSV